MNFENVRVEPGGLLQLEFPDIGDERYLSRFIGYLKNRSIITTTPVENGRILKVRNGQKVIVRFVTNNTANAFHTHIEAISGNPFPHIHLGYPDEIAYSEVRESPRVAVKLAASILNKTKVPRSEKTNGVILDLSVSGCRLEANKAFAKVGDEILMRTQMQVGEIAKIIKLTGKIRSNLGISSKDWLDAEESDSVMSAYGVQFCNMTELDQLLLHAFVFERLGAGRI